MNVIDVHLSAQVEQMLKHDRYLSPHYRYYAREMRILAYKQLLESYSSLTLEYMSKAFGVSVSFIDQWVIVHFVNIRLYMTGYCYYFARRSGCKVLWWVCLCVCLSVHEDISGTTRATFTKFFVHVSYVRGSVLLQHFYDRPHRLSPGRGFLPHWKCIISQERGWECTARAKYAIYDCLVEICYCHWRAGVRDQCLFHLDSDGG